MTSYTAWVLCKKCRHEFYGKVDSSGKLLTEKCNWCRNKLDSHKVLDVYKPKGF
ncbi:hypothetical protein [Pseudomonas phage PP21]